LLSANDFWVSGISAFDKETLDWGWLGKHRSKEIQVVAL